MHNKHGWTERDADGEKREVRATKFGGAWSFASRLKRESWVEHDPVPIEYLETLHGILERKYQRRRASYEEVEALGKLIKERRAAG